MRLGDIGKNWATFEYLGKRKVRATFGGQNILLLNVVLWLEWENVNPQKKGLGHLVIFL